MPWSRRREVKKHVICLLAADGTPLRDPVEMCERAQAFYAGLFSSDPADACRVLWDKLPTVSVGDWDRLALPLTLAKFLEALYLMPTNKFLGMDRLTVEFYRMFWDALVHHLGQVIAEQDPPPVMQVRSASLAAKEGGPLQSPELASRLAPQHRLQGRNKGHLTAVAAGWSVVHPLVVGSGEGVRLDVPQVCPGRSVGIQLQASVCGLSPGAVRFCTVFSQTQLALDGTCELRARSQLYTLATEPVPRLLRTKLTGLVLHEPEVRLVLAVYANDVLLMVQDLDNLVQVEA
ncbi:unnamed protein product [Natator depressus]